MEPGQHRREYLRNSPPKSSGRSESSPHSRKSGVQSSLKRSAGMTRGGTAVRHRNPKRQARETARAFGPPERRSWVKSLPSVASGNGPCENAHTQGGGASRRADACWIVPLTRHEHRVELHQWGKLTFEQHYGVDLDAEAVKVEAEWLRISAREIL